MHFLYITSQKVFVNIFFYQWKWWDGRCQLTLKKQVKKYLMLFNLISVIKCFKDALILGIKYAFLYIIARTNETSGIKEFYYLLIKLHKYVKKNTKRISVYILIRHNKTWIDDRTGTEMNRKENWDLFLVNGNFGEYILIKKENKTLQIYTDHAKTGINNQILITFLICINIFWRQKCNSYNWKVWSALHTRDHENKRNHHLKSLIRDSTMNQLKIKVEKPNPG